MDMVDMVIMATMEREKLNQLLSLSQDIFITATLMDTAMDMVMVIMATMAREKLNQLLLLRLKLSQVIFIMATPMDMVMDTDMDTMVIMERGKLMLRLLQDISMATLMDMVIMDMVDTDTYMVTMAMDTMVKQHLFFYSNIDWNLS